MKDKIIKCVVCILLLLGSMTTSFAQGIFNVSPDTLTWSANDLSSKQFDIICRGAWVADVTACQGLYQLDLTQGYDMCLVTITPLAVNTSSSDRHVAVVITRNNGATVTLHLIHLAPEPEPDPDPWLNVADDLPADHNWIQKTTVTTEDGTSSFRDIDWYDGLGYRSQMTFVGASTVGTSIITPIVYDRMRRDDARVYLPYADILPNTLYRGDAVLRQADYYSESATYNDNRPFTEKEYEPFLSGRPLSWQREGEKWSEDGGHRITFSYRVNVPSDSVWRYRIVPGSNEASYAGMYPAGSLQCTETVGENGSTVRSFADALGQTVCVAQETDDGQWVH